MRALTLDLDFKGCFPLACPVRKKRAKRDFGPKPVQLTLMLFRKMVAKLWTRKDRVRFVINQPIQKRVKQKLKAAACLISRNLKELRQQMKTFIAYCVDRLQWPGRTQGMTKLEFLELRQRNIRTEIKRLTEIEQQYGSCEFTKQQLESELESLANLDKVIASEELEP